MITGRLLMANQNYLHLPKMKKSPNCFSVNLRVIKLLYGNLSFVNDNKYNKTPLYTKEIIVTEKIN